MKVVLHPLFIAVLVVAFVFGFGWVFLALLLAVIVHEFSHMIVARKFGLRADKMRLLPFGAEVSIDCAVLPKDKKIWILLAGSLGNLGFAVVLASLLWLFPNAFMVIEILIVANAVPGVLNLLPIYPLDGGKILHLVAKKHWWVIWWSNAFFVGLAFLCCLFFFNVALLVLCVAMIININLELKAVKYSIYIKTLDKFCFDITKKKGTIKHEE
jgi:stage IV sporulation protein FB